MFSVALETIGVQCFRGLAVEGWTPYTLGVFGPSSVPFWTAVAGLAGVGQVILLTVSAVFVYGYLKETERLRVAAQQQVEAGFRPAVVVMHDGAMEHSPYLGQHRDWTGRWRRVAVVEHQPAR